MADQIDMAESQNEVLMNGILASRTVYQGVSSTHCEECGEDIPEGRRIAVPGCKKCVECASYD